jgi:hypothetical protein
MEESPRRAAEYPTTVDAGGTEPSARPSFIAADREQDGGRLDSVAGSEFVDDRIRGREADDET